MKEFIRDDGRPIQVIDGFRERGVTARRSMSPKLAWGDADYEEAAATRIKRFRRRLSRLQTIVGSLEGARVLDLGCGRGIDTFLLGLQPVKQVVGIDIGDRLFEETPNGERTRRLVTEVLKQVGFGCGIQAALGELPVRFETFNATGLPFSNDSFDVIISHSTLEHVIPIENALHEMARIVRPGGLMHHSIDPFFWLRGCHPKGMVDIPWAHARLSTDEFYRFVHSYEGPDTAEVRLKGLRELNQFTLKRWRQVMEFRRFEILDWDERPSEYAQSTLDEFPEVTETLIDGICQRDLVHGEISVVMRHGECAVGD